MSEEKTITFELADPKISEDYRGSSQTVEILTDMRQHCSRCKKMVLGEPLALHIVDLVSSKERSEAQRAVAVAMYGAYTALSPSHERDFDKLTWSLQSDWLREAADGWDAEHFRLDAVGLGMIEKVRVVGVAEAQKWRAYTDKRKLFRVSQTQFPPGWLHMSFEAHRSRDGKPVRNGNVMVHVCPECAPAVFDAANIDPLDPFGDGVRW